LLLFSQSMAQGKLLVIAHSQTHPDRGSHDTTLSFFIGFWSSTGASKGQWSISVDQTGELFR
jgi:hypothetical protein